MKRVLFLLVTASIGLLLPMHSWGQRPQWGKMSPLLRQLARQEQQGRQLHRSPQVEKEVCSLVRVAETEDAAQVLSEYGCRELAHVGRISIAALPIGSLAALSQDTRVKAMQTGPCSQLHMNLVGPQVGAREAHEGTTLPQAFTGKGVMMGIMDVGFDLTHPNFYDASATHYRIERLWDMLATASEPTSLYVGRDYTTTQELLTTGHSRDGLKQTHGTHTLGTAAGSGYDSPYVGIAPESRICLVANAVTDDLEFIAPEDLYKYTYATDALGFKYIFDYADAQGVPCVISFSEGSPQDFRGYDSLYYELLEELTGPGHIIVASAGNLGEEPSWVHKPMGQLSAGTFLSSSSQKTSFTLKTTNDEGLLRIVTYANETDTLLIPLAHVGQQNDSLWRDTLHSTTDSLYYSVEIEAYPSCYHQEETCYDVQLETNDSGTGRPHPISIELVGPQCDMELYRMVGHLVSHDANPALADAQRSHNIYSPSSAPSVICVGATSYRTSMLNYLGQTTEMDMGTNGIRAPYSSAGPTIDGRIKPDVMAPGTHVISSCSSYYMERTPTQIEIDSDAGHFTFQGRTYGWNYNTGTSMSSPCVGGTIALWLQACPTLTPTDIIGLLQRTCHHYDDQQSYPNNEYGYGEIDAYAGLLDLLGANRIETVSAHHTPARITLSSSRQLCLQLASPLTAPGQLHLYALNGTLIDSHSLSAGTSTYYIDLPSTATGIYAVQLNGPATISGSSLIRIE